MTDLKKWHDAMVDLVRSLSLCEICKEGEKILKEIERITQTKKVKK